MELMKIWWMVGVLFFWLAFSAVLFYCNNLTKRIEGLKKTIFLKEKETIMLYRILKRDIYMGNDGKYHMRDNGIIDPVGDLIIQGIEKINLKAEVKK